MAVQYPDRHSFEAAIATTGLVAGDYADCVARQTERISQYADYDAAEVLPSGARSDVVWHAYRCENGLWLSLSFLGRVPYVVGHPNFFRVECTQIGDASLAFYRNDDAIAETAPNSEELMRRALMCEELNSDLQEHWADMLRRRCGTLERIDFVYDLIQRHVKPRPLYVLK